MIKEELLNPITKVDEGEFIDKYLIRLGVRITPSPDEHQMVSFRSNNDVIYYTFKLIEDCVAFSSFLMKNNIRFETPETSIGARYPYIIGIRKEVETPTTDFKTNYTIDNINKGLELIKELKTVIVRAQDYEKAAVLRDLERYYMDKLEKDKNRKI